MFTINFTQALNILHKPGLCGLQHLVSLIPVGNPPCAIFSNCKMF